MKSVKLISDFREPHYDFMFRPDGEKIYRRMSEEGPDKINQFLILSKIGFRIPLIGTVEYLYRTWKKDKPEPQVVVYLNQFKHCGEGKVLMSVGKAYELFPDSFASLYAQPQTTNPTSYRALSIGSNVIFMKYTSDDSWRSNNGNVEIVECELPETAAAEKSIIHSESISMISPLVAIDFVETQTGQFLAVDLNIAPGIQGTPATKRFSPVTIYEAIEHYLFNHETRE